MKINFIRALVLCLLGALGASASQAQVLHFCTNTNTWQTQDCITRSGSLISGSVSLGTSQIDSGKNVTISILAPGVLATDNVLLDFNADPTATVGFAPSANGILLLVKWPSVDHINVSLYNNTLAPISPGIITMNYRVGSFAVIGSGSMALGVTPILSGTCATVVTVAMTGLLASDNVLVDFNADPTGLVGYVPSAQGMLTLFKWPSVGNLNIKVCNNTGSDIPVGAATVNIRGVR